MASTEFAPVLAALSVMSSSAPSSGKKEAHKYLEDFQKSTAAWTTTVTLLGGNEAMEGKLFAASTLKGKIVYDLDQLPRDQLAGLRQTLLNLLGTYKGGPRPIRTQLCVCLGNLAIQMTEWKDVLPLVGSTLGDSAGDCVLEFLQILPEEVNEGRKINLSEDDLASRSKELLEDNASQVLQLLITYAGSSAKAATNPHLLDCITSWLREIPVTEIAKSSLIATIFEAVKSEDSFDAAVECITTIYRDTKDVDESMEVIQILYPKILELRPMIASAAESGDPDTLKGVTRLFAEAGEAWVVLIARMPKEFRGLVEVILECCARDADKDAVHVTFNFWYDLKQMITVEKFKPALDEYKQIYSRLVDVMTARLQFPEPTGSNADDPFDGDREEEEKFRYFRHELGDVLKSCCEVVGVSECLAKCLEWMKKWVSMHGQQAMSTPVPRWQELEAPLFALRGMGRMVPKDESAVLKDVIPLIVQVPNHSRLRFQATMALGRYTEWTGEHPEFLQMQLKFIIDAFNDQSEEVQQAAALAFAFFGSDCRSHLQSELVNLHGFYESQLDKLPPSSQEDLTKGVSSVIGGQPNDKIYAALKLYCDPVVDRLKQRSNKALQAPGDEKLETGVADTISLITIFIDFIQPYYQPSETNQAVSYCQEILPVLDTVAKNFPKSKKILESLCRCWRYMVLSYRTSVLPLLPALAEQLASGFETTRQGCFLWTTDAVLREFPVDDQYIDPSTSRAVYGFFEQQAFAFLHIMNDLPPQDLPDVIEDFFRLLLDALIYYHDQLLPSAITSPILSAALSALALEQTEPLTQTLHFLRDLLSYGTETPNSSFMPPDLTAAPSAAADGATNGPPPKNRAANVAAVRALVAAQGADLAQRLLTGMMFHFPRDCLPDAGGALLDLFRQAPAAATGWLRATLAALPAGSLKPGEGERLLNGIAQKVQAGEVRKVRVLLQDFTNGYRRRYVAPREGLGRLRPNV